MKRAALFIVLAIIVGVFVSGCGESGPSDQDQIYALLNKAATSIQTQNLSQFLECASDPMELNFTTRTHQYITDTMWPTMPTFSSYQFVNVNLTISGVTATVDCDAYQQIGSGKPSNSATTLVLSKSGGSWIITTFNQAT